MRLFTQPRNERRHGVDVSLGRAEVHDAGTKRKSPTDQRVRQKQLTALLHRGEQLLVESIQVLLDAASGGLSDPTTFPEAGLNLNYGITSNLTADLAINPDFSQIESDQPQIAVNQRFPLFFDEPWKKYGEFTGRARRKEFWFFYLGTQAFLSIASFPLIVFAVLVDEGVIPDISAGPALVVYLVIFLCVLFVVPLILLVPTLAAGVRRMHDIDRSGWWLVVPIVNLVFLCLKGTRGPNRFGADPI